MAQHLVARRNRHILRRPTRNMNRCKIVRIGSLRTNATEVTQMTQMPKQRGTPTATDVSRKRQKSLCAGVENEQVWFCSGIL
jgi:hypothetical protein